MNNPCPKTHKAQRFARAAAVLLTAAALLPGKVAAQSSGVLPLGTNNVLTLSTNSVRGTALDTFGQKTVYAIISCNAVTNANFTGFGTNWITFEACPDTNATSTLISTNWFAPTTNYTVQLNLSNTNYVFTAMITLDVSGFRYLREATWGNNGTNLVSTNLAVAWFYKVQ